ncbi:hypothetical protein Dimus_024735, partial [Dionaea muscipula]
MAGDRAAASSYSDTCGRLGWWLGGRRFMRAEDLRVRAWQFRTLQSGQLSGAALENVLRHRHFYDISTFMTPKLVGTYNLIRASLDYKRHKTRIGELGIVVPLSELANIENQVGNNQASGSGRARAMQGWHSQRLL